MAVVKLIESSSFDPSVGVGAELVFRQDELTKQASTIFGMDYSDMKPDDRHVGIHVVALGDAEHYGENRNGDLFSKKACMEYHPTFVENGNVYRHHFNKDPEKAIGIVKASAYNEPMGRVELFIHADKDKAAPELARLDKEGEIPFSMACIVDHDRCSICGAMRKHAGDESECDHVANHLGEQWDDGRKVGTFNDEPKFFDISFVGKPADRIAWNLTKAASASSSASGVVSSVKLAELHGVEAPDNLAVLPGAPARKLGYARDMAALQDRYAGWLSKSASVVTVRDRYLYGFAKVASSRVDDATLSRMREMPVRDAMSALASRGIVMDVPSFFKYAMGREDYGRHVAGIVSDVASAVPRVLSGRVKAASVAGICNDDTFSAYSNPVLARVPHDVASGLLKVAGSVLDPDMAAIDAAASGSEPRYSLGAVDNGTKVCLNGGVVEKLAEAYLSYQLSAIDAVVSGSRSRGHGGSTGVVATSAARNLQAQA